MEIDLDSDSSSSPIPNPSDPTTQTTPPTTTTISPSQRITELNNIDTSISTLLSSASTAISILANQSQSQLQNTTLSSAQQSFTDAASTYFSTLSSIEVRLRRQVYALEEAGLIGAGDERDARRGRTLNNDDGVLARRGGGGGGEALDPSWLNARVSDAVEVRKKRELLAQGRELVEDVRKRGGNTSLDTDVDMETDGNG